MDRRQFLTISVTAGIVSAVSFYVSPLIRANALSTDTPAPCDNSAPTETPTPSDTPVAAGFHLPYLIDFFTLADGAPPDWFNGSTWKIASGRLVNAPTVGPNLLADPGLEAAYTAGRCSTLKMAGTPVIAQSADAHGGAAAQQFQPAAVNHALYWTPQAALSGEWYQMSEWARRTAGSGDGTRMSLGQTGGLPAAFMEWAINSPAYTQGKVDLLATSAGSITPRGARQSVATGLDSVVIFDDGSLNQITKSSLFSFLPAMSSDLVIKIKPDTLVDNTHIGIVLRADSQADPKNYGLVLYSVRPGLSNFAEVNVIKVIGTTASSLMTGVPLGVPVANAWLEVRASGSTVSIWYNNAQVKSDLTIGDAELLNNPYHGVFSAGDNPLKALFCSDKLIPQTQVFAGSSFAAGMGYRPLVNQYCLSNFLEYDFKFPVLAISGNNTWSNLVRLTTGGDIFILDHANDPKASFVEAMVLRLWAANPATRIILITSPTWYTLDTSQDSLVNAPANQNVVQDIQALAAHYGIALVDYWDWCKTMVNGGTYHLNQLTNDCVHPSPIGYAGIAGLLEPYLPAGGTPMPSSLPARFFADSALYQLPPTRLPGTGYTSRTGTGWTDDGTSISSTTPGDTVTYVTQNAWSSFGSWRSDLGTNLVEISLNADDFSPKALYQNGYDLNASIYNTLTIRIPASGGKVRLEEVWFI